MSNIKVKVFCKACKYNLATLTASSPENARKLCNLTQMGLVAKVTLCPKDRSSNYVFTITDIDTGKVIPFNEEDLNDGNSMTLTT